LDLLHIQRRRLIHRNINSGVRINIVITGMNGATPTQRFKGEVGSGAKKFIPKKPARKEIGMNMVVIMVRVFMISFMRLLITER
jgi:hypothetical protein